MTPLYSLLPAGSRHICCLVWLLALTMFRVANAQAPAWQLGQKATVENTSACDIQAVATDAAGNVYLAGTLNRTATFGTLSVTTVEGPDLFVAKWSRAANAYVWVQRAGGPGFDIFGGLTVSGNAVYLTGAYSNTATIGSTTLTSPNGLANFVARLTDAGASSTWAWATTVATSFNGSIFPFTQIAASGNNVYVTGRFDDRLSFGTTVLTSAGIYDGYVGKLVDTGTAGTIGWVKQVGGTNNDYTQGLAVQGSTVYITGFFQSDLLLGTIALTGSPTRSIYVAKLLDAGATASYVWAQTAGYNYQTYPTCLRVQGNQLYLLGGFFSQAAFGTTTLTTRGGRDSFVAKLTDTGTASAWTWVSQLGGLYDDQATDMVAYNGGVCVVGNFRGQLPLGTTTLSTAGAGDAFATCLVDAGSQATVKWATQAGGIYDDNFSTVALAPAGRLYAAGRFQTPATIGSFAITGINSDEYACFASLTDATTLATTSPQTIGALAAYPNPASGTVRLAGATTDVLVYNAQGQLVRTLPAPATIFNPAGLAPGLYLLQAGPQHTRLVVK